MSLANLDSRIGYGTDIERLIYPLIPGSIETPVSISLYPLKQDIRVIVGQLGHTVRMSAPDLDIVVEGANREQAWTNFLEEIKKREDSAWLSFDVGPTRREEIQEGLNAPEDEDWSEVINSNDEG
jgi:hypothetical protein